MSIAALNGGPSTVVVGAFVMIFDPIFQGLCIALMAGSIASTVLTLVVVPLVHYLAQRRLHPAGGGATPGGTTAGAPGPRAGN